MTQLTKTILLGLTLFIAASTLQAQHVPGFMGKRLFAEAQVGPVVYYRTFLSDSEFDQGARSPLTLGPKMTLNYVMGRKFYLSLEAERHQFIHEVTSVSNLPGAEQVNMRTTLSRVGLGFYTTFRKRKGTSTVAPLGRYFGYRVFHGRLRSKPTEFTANSSSTVEEVSDFYDDNFENASTSFAGLSAVVGNRTMLNDRVSFSLALDVGVQYVYDLDFYEDRQRSRLLFSSSFDGFEGMTIALQAGIGVLLF